MSSILPQKVNTFGQDLLRRYGQRVHKIAIHAGFTCPNRDGSKGRGGCTFCNNVSFGPGLREDPDVAGQIEIGRRVIAKRTKAQLFFAYFQTYTNTYASVAELDRLYRGALAVPGVVGLSVGTRPDCVSAEVLDLLCGYRDEGYEVWLELGLQSAFDKTLERVNRGHGFADYEHTAQAARARGLPLCTHLIIGLPGEGGAESLISLDRVVALGVDGLKLHPLHVVRGTQLANEWRRGEYQPLGFEEYLQIAADMVERTPPEVSFHRLTATAQGDLLLAPDWCGRKWRVIDGIAAELQRRDTQQGSRYRPQR
ncbi:MAG: TIGR01212 family radical SAM protein [Gammaproteobacteria bacterium SHHR-1]|uniref:TIGR01212 family radical SAM protein n=1 Tax=Magnetovirga frankeli TaxID=947516 RepID=UPI0012931D9A|nr:TIGR01212 family radical SAM protein [gamma proteobacterium SS-5]